jgi:hypothetical protein
MNRILLFLFLIPIHSFSFAQDLTGIWRGYFITDNMQQYSYEVQMEQTAKNTLSGVTYSYHGKSFYGKTTMTGTFKKMRNEVLIQEIKTIEVRMNAGSTACIQKCLLTYVKSGREEFLEGTFTSVFEKTDSVNGFIRGGDCGGGKMYLRKVTTSDFYLEPFLRNKIMPKTELPPVTNSGTAKPPVSAKKIPDPQTSANKPPKNTTSPVVTNKKPTVTPTTKPPVEKTTSVPAANNKTTAAKQKIDSALKTEKPEPTNEVLKNANVKPSLKIPAILTQRQNDLLQTLIIHSEKVIVKLYDNGEIDDDTISVYLDNKLILSKQRLTASALTIELKMDETQPEHELVMVAENLGRIPPNTSLMVVTAGDKRYEVRITSTEQKNAVVRFKYVKPG